LFNKNQNLLPLPTPVLSDNKLSIFRLQASLSQLTNFITPTNQPQLPQITTMALPGRYHESWVNRTGPGDARPTAMQIIKDENRIGDLKDKVVVITGCSGGIGVETLRAMHATGATCFATARKPDVLHSVVEEILNEDPSNTAPIHEIIVDLESFQQVRRAAKEILDRSGNRVNILINNAGVMATPEGRTQDGFETQFGTNHLAHFLLFQLLKPALLASSTLEFNSVSPNPNPFFFLHIYSPFPVLQLTAPLLNQRVVNTSSIGHQFAAPRIGDYNFEKEPYSAWMAYGQAKTANIWMANEIRRRYGSSRGLWGYSLHPGGISTGLAKHLDPATVSQLVDSPAVQSYYKNAEQGAATQVLAAVSREWEAKPPKWLSNCEEWGPYGKVKDLEMTAGLELGDDGYKPWAFDEEGAKQLWADSCKFVGVEDDA
jgi:NAD(P)-dependent dehydrogenase (short-subunit alcohol dehydrogenase family)